jgi:hypothetical protein
MTVKAESTVEIPIMNLISILYEDEYYTDWVLFLSIIVLIFTRILIVPKLIFWMNHLKPQD